MVIVMVPYNLLDTKNLKIWNNWLIANCGPMYLGPLQYGVWWYSWNFLERRFIFTKEEDALAFRLTFGL